MGVKSKLQFVRQERREVKEKSKGNKLKGPQKVTV